MSLILQMKVNGREIGVLEAKRVHPLGDVPVGKPCAYEVRIDDQAPFETVAPYGDAWRLILMALLENPGRESDDA